MKKVVLIIAFLSFWTNSYAFDSGTYECKFFDIMTVTVILKDNNRAKVMYSGKTERGSWFDDDDAAILFNDYVLESKDDKFYFNMDDSDPLGTLPCIKK
jgi:hypothetical protein